MKKVFSSILILTFSFLSLAPNFVTAQTIAQPSGTQGANYNTTSQSSGGTGASITSAAGSAVGCAAGQLLSSLLVTSISGLKSAGTSAGNNARTVGTNQPNTDNDVLFNLHAQTGATGPGGIQTDVSFNSIAYCLVNTIIEYITKSTIQWINSGFNGNPAFVNNPKQFFSDIADKQAGQFVQAFIGQTTGLNVCQPIRIEIGTNLARGYNNRSNNLSCSLTSALNTQSGYNSFLNGNNFSFSNWYNVSQNPQNNRYGLEILANDSMNAQITTQQNTAKLELDWNKGFLNYTKCTDDKDPRTCKTQTPGSVIFGQLDNTLSQGKNRLTLATNFDQVVSALVNELIKVALNKVLSN